MLNDLLRFQALVFFHIPTETNIIMDAWFVASLQTKRSLPSATEPASSGSFVAPPPPGGGYGALAAVADNDRGAFMSRVLFSWCEEVVVVGGFSVNRGATAPQVLRVVQVLQGVARQGIRRMFVYIGTWMAVGGVECGGLCGGG